MLAYHTALAGLFTIPAHRAHKKTKEQNSPYSCKDHIVWWVVSKHGSCAVLWQQAKRGKKQLEKRQNNAWAHCARSFP